MRKLILIVIVLVIIYNIIPTIKTYEFELGKVSIPERIETSRSGTLRKELNVKNTNLTVDSDLRNISYLSADDFNKMLENTNLYGIGNALVKVEEEYSINGLYILGLCCLESAYGTSSFAVNRNNLVGWNANDSNPRKC